MIRNYLKQKKRIKNIKNKFGTIIRELNLINSLGEYPSNLEIKFINYGYELKFNIAGICSYKTIENNLDFIRNCFRAASLEVSNDKGLVNLRIFTEDLEEQDYKFIELNNKELLLGYNYNGFIKIDMDISPHLLVSGLPNMGKSKLVNILLKNIKNSDIMVLNGYRKDYKGFECITDIKRVQGYLESVLKGAIKIYKPLYIVLEELQTISNNKKIGDLCKELLSVGRHIGAGVFVIGIIQIATKENCKFKDLFGNRVSLKQIENSSYSVCLGVSIEEELSPREFYCYGSCGMVKGKTYFLN